MYVSSTLEVYAIADHNSCQFDLLDQWTQFLIAESLVPANQISTDDFAGSLANQTNLAIKGIVGIKAMSQIASLVGQTTKSDNYSVRFFTCEIDASSINFESLSQPPTFPNGRSSLRPPQETT